MSEEDSAVRVVQWPAEKSSVDALVAAGTPFVALVADGAEPPLGTDCLHDWMWASGDEVELRYRLRQVALRAGRHRIGPPRLDEHGILSFGMRSVGLPAREAQVAGVLLRRFGDVVTKDEVIAAVSPSGLRRPTLLATHVSRLRRRIAPLGLEVAAAAGAGYVLRVSDRAGGNDDPGASFDEEVDVEALRSGGTSGSGSFRRS